MKKIFLFLLILAFLLFTAGFAILFIPALCGLIYISLPLIVVATLITLATCILRMVLSFRKFRFRIRLILKILVVIISFVLFTVGLGLLIVAKMIVLGILLAAAGLLSFLFLIPMFIGFVRVNPFEHVIVNPKHNQIDTEFFIEKDEEDA